MWDKLYEMKAAFKPEVNGELDTQNFMKFDEVLYSLFLAIACFNLLFIFLIIVVVSWCANYWPEYFEFIISWILQLPQELAQDPPGRFVTIYFVHVLVLIFCSIPITFSLKSVCSNSWVVKDVDYFEFGTSNKNQN